MKTPFCLIVFGSFVAASPARSQRYETLAPRARADTVIAQRSNQGAYRLLGSVAGVVGGAFIGGYLGYNVLPHDCGCDDPGLDAIIYGGLAGAAIGAAIGASAPDLHSVCSFDRRFARSLAGSAIGAAATWLLSGAGETILIAVPAGAVGGSLAALGRCWKTS